MKKNKKPSGLDKFKALFGHGYFRPFQGGYEVRVKDLDSSLQQAKKINAENNLELFVGDVHAELRSFLIKEARHD